MQRLSIAAPARMVNRTRPAESQRTGPMNPRNFLAFCSLLAAVGPLTAQNYTPPEPILPDEVTQREIGERTRRLSQAVEVLRRQHVSDPFLVDVEVYLKAALWID